MVKLDKGENYQICRKTPGFSDGKCQQSGTIKLFYGMEITNVLLYKSKRKKDTMPLGWYMNCAFNY